MPPKVGSLFESCVSQYSGSSENRNPFGLALKTNASAYVTANASNSA